MTETFTKSYIECALWSSTDGDGRPLDSGEHELSADARAQMVKDCEDFEQANADLLERWYSEAGETTARAGHDFWLTRNRHGAGFWDRWNDATPQGKIGRELTEKAHAYGEVSLYIGDDGAIYA